MDSFAKQAFINISTIFKENYQLSDATSPAGDVAGKRNSLEIRYYGFAKGKVNVNVDPFSFSLSTVINPWWRSTI